MFYSKWKKNIKESSSELNTSSREKIGLIKDSASSPGIDEKTIIEQLELDRCMTKLEVTLQDMFIGLIIQFGFIILFSGFFPLVFLVSFTINVLSCYFLGLTFTFKIKRTESLAIEDIGIWNLAMSLLAFAAPFYNAGVIIFQAQGFELLFRTKDVARDRSIILVGLALTVLLMYLIRSLIPKKAWWTKEKEMMQAYYDLQELND